MRTKTTNLELEAGFACLMISYYFDDFAFDHAFGTYKKPKQAVLEEVELYVEVAGRSINATAGLTDSQRDHFKKLAEDHLEGLEYASDD